MDIAFALNYTNLWMVDLTPTASARTWARIGAGISSITINNNETVADDEYYDMDGASEPAVTGLKPVFSFSGDRKFGDPAQDYIAGLRYAIGNARRTNFKHIGPDGTVDEGACTIANIVDFGGDANAKGTFSFELHCVGLPSFTAGSSDEFPTSVTATAVTVAVGGTSAVNATVTPATASTALVYAVEDDTVATVDAMGNVKGIKAGTTNLSVKSAVLPTVRASVTVTVS